MKKVVIGNPIGEFSIVKETETVENLPVFSIETEKNGFVKFVAEISEDTVIYGLGETVGKINKRGELIVAYNTDNPHQTEESLSLYGAHNFLILDDIHKTPKRGFYFDTPARVTFDLDTKGNGKIKIIAETKDLRVYFLEGETSLEITRKFREYIGTSYIPPLWAFGFSQSRWGYKKEKDIRNVIDSYHKAGMPIDSVCMDIDYMDRYIDFTINKKRFPDLKKFSEECLQRGVHLVPIIDAGVKIEPGNPVYDEGIEKDYFSKNIDGKPFMAAVWPGPTHFPDFFRNEVREWFGEKYKVLTDAGIEGFWNDMNEPAIFYSEATEKKTAWDTITSFLFPHVAEKRSFEDSNAYKSYPHFYHMVDGKSFSNHEVHNQFGGYMTMAGNQGLTKLLDKRFLLYSRASYIGAHRYGGIWTGDNESRWEHLKMNVRQMPSLNMVGFLYSGADTCGFGGNTDRELALRWHAFSLFTPLFRNHTAIATKNQECYRFEKPEDFRNLLELRYKLIPYIYSEFVKAALKNDLYIKPLSFQFPYDEKAVSVEDQLIVGESLMVTPITDEGEAVRLVYLPTDMTLVRYANGVFSFEEVKKGTISVNIPLNEVVFFLLKDKSFIVYDGTANSTEEMDLSKVKMYGDVPYEQYLDDGYTRNITLENIRKITKQ